MAYPRKITRGLYSAIKRLQEDGSSIKEVCDYFSLSRNTVDNIFKSETIEEYNNITLARKQIKAIKAKEEKEKKEEVTQHTVHHQVTVAATHYMQEELRKQTELLTIISNKLAFVVDELTK